MEWSDSALVLNIGKFREADIWLHLLTRRHGLIHAFAFGGSHSRRRFPGCLDLLNRLIVHIDTGRTGRFPNLKEAVFITGPRRLRNDGDRLGTAINCVRFLEALAGPPDEEGRLFDLTGSILALLEQSAEMPEMFPLWFRFRLAFEQGFAPDFLRCSQCGRELTKDLRGALWRVSEGSVRCALCSSNGDTAQSIHLEPGMVAALIAFQHDSPGMWRVEGLPTEERQELIRIVDEFIEYHLGLRWERGRFVKA